MKRLFVGIVLVCGSAAPAWSQAPGARLAVRETALYPLKVGTTWVYRAGDVTITSRIAAHERIGGIACGRVDTIINGEVVSYEHIAATDASIARFSYNGYRPGEPVPFLKFPPKAGEAWHVRTAINGETIEGNYVNRGQVSVTVPAGTFNAWLVTGEFIINGRTTTVVTWFAENVGIVKVTLDQSTLELAQFVPGT